MSGFLKNAIGMLAAGVLASGLVLAAWALSPKSEPVSEPPHGDGAGVALEADQLVGRWSFVDAKNQQAFVEFTEYGSWFGSDGCNGTQGSWATEGAELTMAGSGVSTLIFCDNANLPTGQISGSLNTADELELHGSEGDDVTLQRTGDGTMSLTDVAWAFESVDGKTLPAGVDPEITFADDGTWSGTDGCNRMNGTWSWKPELNRVGLDSFGAVLQLGAEIASTKMACIESSPFPANLVQPHWLTVFSADAILLQDPSAADAQRGIFLRRVDASAQG